MRRSLVFVAGAAAVSVAAYRFAIEPWWRMWGVNPADADRELPGDDVVSDPGVVDTRSIEIDAPPAEVWPWLVQMGFGRAGWYSYDAIDMRGASATGLLPDPPSLAVGDVLPTHPDGGFEVRAIDPGRSLTLFIDTALATRQAAEARARKSADGPANLKLAGSFMAASQPPEFAASLTFVLEPIDGARTRLIERVRVSYASGQTAGSRLLGPLFGFGVFLMTRKQMLGIRGRVEGMTGLSPAAA